jgi:hypothetical protein
LGTDLGKRTGWSKTDWVLIFKLIGESLGADVIAKIRHCANKGLILGAEKFKQQFEEITGDSLNPIDQ